jgi:choline kinase
MSSTKSIVISCAGLGSRLGLGQTKALLQIGNKSLIQWQIEAFRDVKDIRVVIGYQSKDVINEVLKIRDDVIFVYNHDYFNTKTGASFYLGARDANEYVIEWDGDMIVHPADIKKILDTPGEFLCYSEITSEDSVYVNIDNNGLVNEFSKISGNFEWTGPVCIKKSKIKYTKENVYDQITPHLPMKGFKIRAYDIDTYDDYIRVVDVFNKWSNEEK